MQAADCYWWKGMSGADTTFRGYLLILKMKGNGLGESHSWLDAVHGVNSYLWH